MIRGVKGVRFLVGVSFLFYGADADGKLTVQFTDPSPYCTAAVNGNKVKITHKKDDSLINIFDIDSIKLRKEKGELLH